jgi:hypothetical protein
MIQHAPWFVYVDWAYMVHAAAVSRHQLPS